ncbi:hypothetical protein 162319423 [Organic Lake phycodnavirus 2]|jgi:hypothetical protein|nr:hypothetical protein 162319423 [Organic Lake phycodnavirus 2]
MYIPLELQNYIFSFLPILSPSQKRLNHIVNHYNVYFERELCKQYDYLTIYNCWLNKNLDIKIFLKDNKMTMLQIQQLYHFALPFFY